MDNLAKYKTYAEDVLSNKIVACKNIKLACQRYLDWFKRDDIEFRADKADRVVRFIETLKHFKGAVAGKHFILEEWQKWVLYNIFAWYWKGTNERVTTKVLLMIARKNGKSALAAAIALYLLVGDEDQGVQVVNVANTTQQASLLFEFEENMLKSIDPHFRYFRFVRNKIRYTRKKSWAMVLSPGSPGLDGYGAHFICDESHMYKDSKLWDVLIGGQMNLTSPLAINISTAGHNNIGFLAQYREMCVDILSGKKENDSQFSAIYELDPDDDWQDESVWIKANPNLGVSVNIRKLRDQVLQAQSSTILSAEVLTKNFNRWVQNMDAWMSDELITNNMEALDMDKLAGEKCWMGVDISATQDLTAWTLMFPPNKKRDYYPDKYIFKTYLYVPEQTFIDSKNNALYRQFAHEGFVKKTKGNVVDQEEILKDMLDVKKKYNLKLMTVAYDDWNSIQWSTNAERAGLYLVIYSQKAMNFNIPTKSFEILINTDKILLDYNTCVRFCFQNAVLKYDTNDNCKPVKPSKQRHKKIDAVISILESLGIYLIEEKQNSSQAGDIFILPTK